MAVFICVATLTAAINYYRNALQYADPKVSAKRLNGLKVPVLSIFGTGDKYLSVAAAKGSRKFIKVSYDVFVLFEDFSLFKFNYLC